MVNVLFSDSDYKILPKQKEVYEKYCKILQWGRKHPTRFLEDFMNLQFTDHQKYILLSSWVPSNVVWVCSRSSGKALALDTKVWTVDKNTRKVKSVCLGDIKVGDKILDVTGNLAEVVHLNSIIFDNYYELEFEDGEKIKCNGEHLWNVFDDFSGWMLIDTFYLNNLISNRKKYGANVYVPIADHLVSNTNNKKKIIGITRGSEKIAMRCITMDNDSGTFLCGEHMTVTHNSFMLAPFIMAKSLLFPSFKTYIMGPTGLQAMETFTKLENLAKNNIASVIGVTSVFLDECKRLSASPDPFSHNKSGYHVELYNGSEINSLNGVAKNIVGIRSNLNAYDEAGKKFARLKSP